MKIEEINSKKLSKVSKQETYILHLRFIQLYNKNFKGNNKQRVGDLERDSFLDKYKLLIKEMDSRKLTHSIQDIDRALFRKSIYGLDIAKLDELVIVPDYISMVGGHVSNPKESKDVDIVIREDEGNRNTSNELLINRAVRKALGYDKKI